MKPKPESKPKEFVAPLKLQLWVGETLMFETTDRGLWLQVLELTQESDEDAD